MHGRCADARHIYMVELISGQNLLFRFHLTLLLIQDSIGGNIMTVIACHSDESTNVIIS
jgi:hypothetical protein